MRQNFYSYAPCLRAFRQTGFRLNFFSLSEKQMWKFSKKPARPRMTGSCMRRLRRKVENMTIRNAIKVENMTVCTVIISKAF